MTTGAIATWLGSLPDAARSDSAADLTRIATHVAKCEAQFLLGAGMSKASGLPLAQEIAAGMVKEILDGAGRPDDNDNELARLFPLESIAEAYLETHDQSKLTRLIRDKFGDAKGTLHPGHAALEYLSSQRYIERVYTTNFDGLIEKAFGARGETVHDGNFDNLGEYLAAGRFPVFHLHGHFDGACLIEESKVYALNTPIQRVFTADLVQSRFIWVGYSLSDLDLRSHYFSNMEVLRAKGLAKKPFVVLPIVATDTDLASREWRLARAVWKSRHATYVPGKAETFLPALVERVKRVRADDLVTKIISSRGGNPADATEIARVWESAKTLSSGTGIGDEIDAVAVLARAEGVM